MSEPEKRSISAGARNPKEVRIGFGVTEKVNSRLEHLCDVAGMNKGAMAGVVFAAGLQTLESAILGLNPEVMVAAARRYDQLQKRDVVEGQEASSTVSEEGGTAPPKE